MIRYDDQINLFLNSDKLNIKTTNGKYSLSTLPSSDFPIFDIDSGDSPLVIPAKDLRELIKNTSFAMGNQDWRHYLNGLYLSISNGEITAVTTDAHRLAVANLSTQSDNSFSGLLPRTSLTKTVSGWSTKFSFEAGNSYSLLCDIMIAFTIPLLDHHLMR